MTSDTRRKPSRRAGARKDSHFLKERCGGGVMGRIEIVVPDGEVHPEVAEVGLARA
jgi:hypothetical protein